MDGFGTQKMKTSLVMSYLSGGDSTVVYTAQHTPADVWAKLHTHLVDNDWLVSCSTQFDRPHKGLVPYHAYTVMGIVEALGHRLVHLRNTWGHGEWNGAFADGSSDWTAAMRAAVPAHTDEDDGCFFMPLFDFMECFGAVTMTRILDDVFRYQKVLQGLFVAPDYCGGYTSMRTPMYRLSFPKGIGSFVCQLTVPQLLVDAYPDAGLSLLGFVADEHKALPDFCRLGGSRSRIDPRTALCASPYRKGSRVASFEFLVDDMPDLGDIEFILVPSLGGPNDGCEGEFSMTVRSTKNVVFKRISAGAPEPRSKTRHVRRTIVYRDTRHKQR